MSEIELPPIERLMALMQENEISEFHYQNGEVRVELRRGWAGHADLAPAPALPLAAPVAAAAAPTAPAGGPAVAQDDGLLTVSSPMVGTFYASSDPDSPPFVKVGTAVSKDTTVCLIEAMKVFNDIKAEIDGTIERVAVSNGDAVEYGQVLFYVRP